MMFLFNLLKREDRRLRVVSIIVTSGLCVLLAGLWFVQIVCANRFENNSRKQSLKRVGIPAIRGRILDRNGLVLANSLPHYNAILYLEDLQGQFGDAYKKLVVEYGREHPSAVQSKGRVRMPDADSRKLRAAADCQVVSNITAEVGATLQETRVLNTNAFLRHYSSYPYVPFEVVPNLSPGQLARFAEQLSGQPELEIETEPVRNYPNGDVAAHVLGFVQREFVESDEISYTLPDYTGKTGIERLFDTKLKGSSGIKLVLVNSLNYRQNEEIDTANAPGEDIYLTIDLNVQRAAEQAMARHSITRGAVVVLDCRNGDVLAMASAPTYDPNGYVRGLTHEEVEALTNQSLTPQLNRAIDGAYPPGSTFKVITAIACLENGLDPEEQFNSIGYWQETPRAKILHDTAGPGLFNFKRAFFRSSNTYFINYGEKASLKKILAVAKRFHMGEKTDFAIHPEVAGNVPPPEKVGVSLPLSSTADVCIGQEITTTPLQMACVYGALAMGGKMYWPRIVSHGYLPETGQEEQLTEPGRLRDIVPIDPHHLQIIREAMLADTEQPATADSKEGTAYVPFHFGNGQPRLANFHVAGKTGTAQVRSRNSYYDVTWFNSYAPYEDPRYVVVVLADHGASGGGTCAPVAEAVYEAIVKSEQAATKTPGSSLAKN
jgi:penicillin-binding protein 2